MRGSLRATLLTASVFTLGMEMARFHFASLGWYQRDTLGVGALDLVPIALIPFLAGLVLPLLTRFLSLRYSLAVGVLVLAAARVANQIIGDPAIDHWSSGVAVAAFIGLLPLLLSHGREVLVSGVLLGITFDSAVNGLGMTLDLASRPGVVSLAAVVLLAAVMVSLTLTRADPGRNGPAVSAAFALMGLGPFLFAQYLVLQSPGWLAEVTGLPSPAVLVGIPALNALGIWLAHRWGDLRWATAGSTVLVAVALALAEGRPTLFLIVVVTAIPAAAVLWAGLVPETPLRSIGGAAFGIVTGFLIFLLIGFAYYLPLDLKLGFSQSQVRIAGAVLILLFGAIAALRHRLPSPRPAMIGLPVGASALVVLPLIGLLGATAMPPPPDSGPVRYMSYNLHQAFGTAGNMDVAAIADVIVDSGATVVGLQEIARGGLLNAGTDLVYLLGERLGWEHIAFFGTTDPVWGNAILSRYDIGEVERQLLPRVGTPFQRGYLAAPVATPEGEVLFISTHLQHVDDPEAHREDPEADLYDVHHEQLSAVLEHWNGRTPAVLVGDMNARPGWRQVEELAEAGWVDSWAEAGSGPGYTSNAADPQHRIDYIFHTPDLSTVAVEVIESQASDHFAVVADLTGG